ncbi:MAG: hypothetical protein A3K06_03910 [Candidatus Doudnabacteria bacterium RIFCSPHIGHO2_01_52_17]|uniref:Cytidyltransferase-like domain-containing protein n=1 Tax=Candidatus Doudnabacteria bacterium RIFCSPHIGHO2_01_52_17 TaxID=1817820 RepID=A0A1F5NF19_9BACT|nr:MAG: hypothetical protein A3K06_03910 [Candidatus Doudnabacteria bacterium RIFCSPHIGHO2_01_52_17]
MKRVLVFGTFDVIHPGHISFLRQAKKYGDFLIVSLAREKFVLKIKGHSARHSEAERRQLLESLKIVDKVVFGSKIDYLRHIANIKPSVIVLGYDQSAFTEKLREKLAERGLRVKIVRAKAYKPHLYKTSRLVSF